MPKVKEEFWAVLFRYEPFRFGPSPTARYSGTMFFPYRYKVEGINLKNVVPRRHSGRYSVWNEYSLFAYRLNNTWRVHEIKTGVIVKEGRTIDEAMDKFMADLNYLERRRSHEKHLRTFSAQVKEMRPSSDWPEMPSEEAFRIIIKKEEEKKRERLVKKELKLQQDAALEGRSLDPHSPREV
jgi:hypothetical protein